jgi:hypothetical protein
MKKSIFSWTNPKSTIRLLFISFVSYQATAQNNSLDLSDGDNAIEITNASNLFSGANFTLEFTLQVHSTPANNTHYTICGWDHGGSAFDRSPSLWLYNSGGSNLRIHADASNTAGTGRYNRNIDAYPETLNEWNHFAWVYDAGNSSFYVNGELVDTASLTGGLDPHSSYFIGKTGTGFNSFDGELDEFRIWSSSRTQLEIQENMWNELMGSETGLQAYYNFNTPDNNTLTDNSGNGFSGTIDANISSSNFIGSGAFTSWDNSGTADWTTSSNWSNGIPGINSSNISIPAGGAQPEISTAVSLKSLTMEPNATLTLKNGAALTTTDKSYIQNNGTLTMESGSSMTVDANAEFKVNNGGTLSSSGDITVNDTGRLTVDVNGSMSTSGDMTLNGAGALYIESSAAGTGNFIYTGSNLTYPNSGSATIERYLTGTTNALAGYHYVSSPVASQAVFGDESDLYAYRESDLTWLHHSDVTDGFSSFTPGAGYAMRYGTNTTKAFTGAINTGTVNISVTHTDNPSSAYEYYNFFGNPYPCSISATSFINANSSILGNTVNLWSGLDFATYNTSLAAGTAGSSGVTPDDNISIGQAFFVNSTAAGTVSFTIAMQTTDSDQYFRQKERDLIRLNVHSSQHFNQLIVAADEQATDAIEKMDSKKLMGNESLALYSICEGTKLAIQTVKELSKESFISLGLTSNTSDWFEFSKDSVSQFDKDLYLWDTYANKWIDLNQENYKVYLEEGEYNHRFKLTFMERTASASDHKNEMTAYVRDGNIQLDLSSDIAIESARLYSINGTLVKSWNTNEAYNISSLLSGVYLLEVATGERKYIQKIIK